MIAGMQVWRAHGWRVLLLGIGVGPVGSLLIALIAVKRRRVFLAHRTCLLASLKLARVLTATVMLPSEEFVNPIPESNSALGLLLLPWYKVGYSLCYG
jgi:hypothetical protein